MPLLLTMSLFGSVGTLFYIMLLPLSKKYLSVKWRRVYLICNILEYLIPFPYYHAKYKKFLNAVFVKYLPQRSAGTSLYLDDTTNFIQVTTGRVEIPNTAVYVLITGIVIAGLSLFGYQMHKYRKIKKYLRFDTKEITNDGDNRVIKECVCGYKRAERVRIYRCGNVDTPFTIGIIRPIIVIPDIEWIETELALVVEHEMTHIRHRDNLIKILALSVLALNFYNPLAFLVLHEWNVVAELFCDETVISNKTEDEITQYGLLIIKIAEDRTDNENIPVMGFNMQDKIMKERIRQMKRGTKKLSLPKKLLGAGVMGVMLFTSSLSVLAYSPKDVWYRDSIADEFVFCEEGVASWGNADEDLPVNVNDEWIFTSQDGEITEVLDKNDIEAGTYSLCDHEYKSGELAAHTRYSDGSCKIEYYYAKKCIYCGHYEIGDWKNTVTFAICTH